MKIQTIGGSVIKNKGYAFKGKQLSIEELSGLSTINKYSEKLHKENKKEQENEQSINSVLYYSIFNMADKGKYNSAKVLFDDLRKKNDLESDAELNNVMGNVSKNTGDLESANIFYRTAYNNAENSDFTLKLNSLQNYQESNMLLGKDVDISLEPLGKVNEPYQNMVYLFIESYLDERKNNFVEASNDIKASYKIMKEKGHFDPNIEMKTAMFYSEEGDYEKSNKILKENLNILEKEGKAYTKEFIDRLLLLGINEFETAEKNDFEKSVNLLQNASEIADITGIQQAKEIADFVLTKIMFVKKDKNFQESANELLNRAKNTNYKANLNEMLGDFYAQSNTEMSLKYYNAGVDLLKRDESGKEKIFTLYTKIKELRPEETLRVDAEIEKLNAENLYNPTQLLKTFDNMYNQKDYEKLENAANFVFEESTNDINKIIATAYLNFAKMQKGSDMNKCIENINKAIDDAMTIYEKAPDNRDLQKFLFNAHCGKSVIFYDSIQFSRAAVAINEADKFINEKTLNDSQITKQKIIATLMNYKAQKYGLAEKYAIQYLAKVIGIKELPLNPGEITDEINKILVEKNDTEKRKIASGYETLGLINLKNRNFEDSLKYFSSAVDIRERLKDKDLQLANSYAALSRLAIINSKLFEAMRPFSSKDLHQKSLDILKLKYPNDEITKEEMVFHKKYYGIGLASAGKYIKNYFGSKDEIIEKFKCYNKELSICE